MTEDSSWISLPSVLKKLAQSPRQLHAQPRLARPSSVPVSRPRASAWKQSAAG